MMESLLIHVLKSSALLSVFFLTYHFLLIKDTHFSKNRIFLLAGMFTAVLLPFVHFSQTVVVEPGIGAGELLRTTATSISVPSEQEVDLWQIAGFIYLLISGILLSKMTFQVFGVLRLALMHQDQKRGKYLYIQTDRRTSPYSWFCVIVYNPAFHPEGELTMILEHEKVHSRQLHSVDKLLANLAAAFLWFNPLTWLYKESVEVNLEYIADRETIRTIGKQKEYQYALLRISQGNVFPGLMNHFHRSFIKSRIIMLEKRATSRNQEWKRFLVLPLLVFFLYGFNTRKEIVFSDNNKSLHSNPAMEQGPVFFIDSSSPDSHFRAIESYFRNTHRDMQIAFTGVTRNTNLDLTGFTMETRFRGEKRFTKRMENYSERKLKPRFSLQYSSEEQAIIMKEQYEEELQMTITKDAIHTRNIHVFHE